MTLVGSSARRVAIAAAAAAATLVAGSAVAVSARPVAATTVLGRPAGTRFNVAAPHSPKLERMLAGNVLSAGAATTAGLVKGIDVSSHQHDGGAAIGWAKVAAAGYKFAFVKATEGSYYVNPHYAADVAAARRAGLLVAAYHFAIPNDSRAVLQADLAMDAAGDQAAGGQTLPLVIDLEYDPYASQDGTNECYGLSQGQMVAWISAFVAEVKRRTGQLPVIYTIENWWKACTGGSAAFAADPLWVASPGTSPTLPVGWSSWEYWQYTSSANVPGIAGPTDVSYFSSANPDAPVPAARSDGVGSAANLALRALDAAAGRQLTWSASGLPPGMTIDTATGQITGTLPAAPARYQVGVTVTDAASDVQSLKFRWAVHGAVRLPSPGRQRTVAGAAVDIRLAAQDGLPGCSLTFTASGLPPGLSLGPCGLVTGFPGRPGSYQVSVRAGDSANPRLTSVSFPWTVGPPPTVADGRLRLAAVRKCLAGPAGTSATRTPRIWTCGRSAGQRWGLGMNGPIRMAGECLAAIDVSAGHAAATMRACAGRTAQLWRQTARGGLANAQTGFTLCLADPGASHVNGTRLGLAYCDGSAGQAWTLPAGPLAPGQPGRCLTAHPATTAGPATVSLARCLATARQAWELAPAGSIAAAHLCLHASQPATPGEPVSLAACRAGAAQRWRPIPGAAGQTGSLIVNPSSGLCMATTARHVPASPLVLGYCVASNPRLAWRIS
jgi:GH25 family lysozyme M1 (1,4-beta-N-acetylmuramidase)